MEWWGILIIVIAVVAFLTFLASLARIRKCPSDKIMVVYGKLRDENGEKQSAKCIHGGVKFIWPVIQHYQYMDLTPMSIGVDLKSALSKQNIRIDVPSIFTVGISTEPTIMQNAAERLLGLRMNEIKDLAKDIIFGQLRLVIATMEIEEINTDRDKFLEQVSRNVEGELKKIGLRLINVNVTDISDESGYIVALGKESAAKAINDAKKTVAEKNRDGSIGEANAQRDQRIEVSLAESSAIGGENEAKILIAHSDSLRREREAEAQSRAVASENIQRAKALEESYSAEQKAEKSRAEREKATQEADIIIAAEISKRRMELEAEAEAEQIRRRARGEADAIYAKLEAQARGAQEILERQALGFSQIVKSASNSPEDAVKLLIADKLEELVKLQVEAIKNIKIDKVTVWDGGQSKDGKTSTANFLSGMAGSLPPMQELFNMAGMQLPEFLGKPNEAKQPAVIAIPEVKEIKEVKPAAEPPKAKPAVEIPAPKKK